MRIVIDLQGAQGLSRLRGIGRYSLELALAVARNRGEHEVLIALSDMIPDSIAELRAAFHGVLPRDAFRVWTAPGPVLRLEAANEQRCADAELIREAFLASLEPDVVLVASLFEGLGDNVVTSVGRLVGLPTAVVLYDLIPLLNPADYLPTEIRRKWYGEKIASLERADHLLAISQSAASEAVTALHWAPEGVTNISTAASSNFRPLTLSPEDRERLAAKYSLAGDYVMYTGGFEPRKNLERLVRAYGLLPGYLREAHRLLIVGNINQPDTQKLMQIARSAGLSPSHLVITGFVDDDELVSLYNGCKLFVFPSLHEGFGLPALEAMQCGRAVIASNNSSLPEVVGYRDALFDPHNEADIAAHMERALADDEFRQRLEVHGLTQARNFSWDLTAKRAIAALEGAFHAAPAAIAPAAAPKTKPRLAFVSPLPPARSGIADYAADLLQILGRYYDIDVVIEQDGISDASVTQNVGVWDVEWFEENFELFDRVVYQFGNSPFHTHMFELLERIPGVVVLHDFFLSGVIAHSFPASFAKTLVDSHGYTALLAEGGKPGVPALIRQCPANLPVLQNALQVIVHSDYSRVLADEWYGPGTAAGWDDIPLLRRPAQTTPEARSAARHALGLDDDALLVCSFGYVDPVKLSRRLVDAFLKSSLASHKHARLVFVGDHGPAAYSEEMLDAARRARLSHRVTITGWTDKDEFDRYLQAADIAVQLRTNSRGETSAAVLDGMNHGIATIANANGSMAELDREAVRLLPDAFEDDDLVVALEELAADAALRKRMGARGQDIVHSRHHPEACARAYYDAIEKAYAGTSGAFHALPKLLGQPADAGSQEDLASALSVDFPPSPRRRQLLIDVSQLATTHLHSGIQRVSRAILLDLLNNPPDGWSVEPITRVEGHRFHYAREFTARFLGIEHPIGGDAPTDAWAGDIYLDCDSHPGTPESQAQLQEWKRRGVDTFHIVYDLLPLRMPHKFPGIEDFFRAWVDQVVRATGAVCISKTVAGDLADWIVEQGATQPVPLDIGWFHLGADVTQSAPTRGLPADAHSVLAELAKRPTFLMVSTIEPRKGYRQAVAAFEALWARGVDVNLVMVGKPGWHMDDLIAHVRGHGERGKRLFWPSDVSDEYLERLYAASTCLIAGSEGEGFGLPLIEAAQHKLPVLARDIPVFREVAGEHATYFDGLEPDDLARAVEGWLKSWRTGAHVRSDAMPWITWQESTRQLLRGIGIGTPSAVCDGASLSAR